jgi:hypothetical protein
MLTIIRLKLQPISKGLDIRWISGVIDELRFSICKHSKAHRHIWNILL